MASYAFLAATTSFPKEGQALPHGVFGWLKTLLAARRERSRQRELADQLAAMEPRLLADIEIDPDSLPAGQVSLSSMNPMVLAVTAMYGTKMD